METQNEKEHLLLKIKLQRKCLMEAAEEEKVPRYKAGIRTHPKRLTSERKRRMEKEKEASLFKEMALQHLRLETRHCFSIQVTRIQLVFQPGVCERT